MCIKMCIKMTERLQSSSLITIATLPGLRGAGGWGGGLLVMILEAQRSSPHLSPCTGPPSAPWKVCGPGAQEEAGALPPVCWETLSKSLGLSRPFFSQPSQVFIQRNQVLVSHHGLF